MNSTRGSLKCPSRSSARNRAARRQLKGVDISLAGGWIEVATTSAGRRGRDQYALGQRAEQHNYAAAVKTGLELTGYPAGPPRKPFALLEKDARAELAGLLRAAGVEVAG